MAASVIRRGDVYWADLAPVRGHEQEGKRPVLVISDDRYNGASHMAIVVPLTTRQKPWRFPLIVFVGIVDGKSAWALPAQVRAISAVRLGAGRPLGTVLPDALERVVDGVARLCGRPAPAPSSGAPPSNDTKGGT
jgi:mRNA interferase MazF